MLNRPISCASAGCNKLSCVLTRSTSNTVAEARSVDPPARANIPVLRGDFDESTRGLGGSRGCVWAAPLVLVLLIAPGKKELEPLVLACTTSRNACYSLRRQWRLVMSRALVVPLRVR